MDISIDTTKQKVIIVDDEPKPTSQHTVIEGVQLNKEIKPFDSDYVHIYDPNGDQYDPSTKTPSQILKEEQEENKINLSSEQSEIQMKRDLVHMIRCSVLHRLNKHPLINFMDLTQYEKKKITKEIKEIFEDIISSTEKQKKIKDEFGEIVQDVILSDKADISKYLVYKYKN